MRNMGCLTERLNMLNFSIVNWGLGQEPQAMWRAKAALSQSEAEKEFLAAAQACSYERLLLVNDDTPVPVVVAEAVRFSDKIEITLYRH
jgi:hypothetical protein